MIISSASKICILRRAPAVVSLSVTELHSFLTVRQFAVETGIVKTDNMGSDYVNKLRWTENASWIELLPAHK